MNKKCNEMNGVSVAENLPDYDDMFIANGFLNVNIVKICLVPT